MHDSDERLNLGEQTWRMLTSWGPWYRRPEGAGIGKGKAVLLGADEGDFATKDGADTAIDFIRLRARELCSWLNKPGMESVLLDQSRDVIIRMIPLEFLREGSSSSTAILLAMLTLYLGCRIKPKVAVTCILCTTGYILGVGSVVVKIRAALAYGASVVVVPAANRSEVEEALTSKQRAKVRFAFDAVGLLQHAVEGKLIVSWSMRRGHLNLMMEGVCGPLSIQVLSLAGGNVIYGATLSSVILGKLPTAIVKLCLSSVATRRGNRKSSTKGHSQRQWPSLALAARARSSFGAWHRSPLLAGQRSLGPCFSLNKTWMT